MNHKHYRRMLEDSIDEEIVKSSDKDSKEEPKSSIELPKPHPKDPVLGPKSRPIPSTPDYEKRVRQYIENKKKKLSASEDMKKAPYIDEHNTQAASNLGPYVQGGSKAKIKNVYKIGKHTVHHWQSEDGDSFVVHHNYDPKSNPIASVNVDRQIGYPEMNESYHDNYYVQHAAVNSEHKGKGLGRAAYKAAIKHFGKLQSSTAMSPLSNKAWEKLSDHPQIKIKFGIDDNTPHVAEYVPKSGVKPKKLAASEQSKNQDDLIHYSSEKGLKVLDPKFMGTGVSGHQVKRGVPENKSVFFYTAESEPESIVATPDKTKYRTKIKPEHKVYDLESDPANLMSEFRKQNQGIWNEDAFHGYLKDRGFHGVRWKMRDNTSVVQMYHPMEVEEMQKNLRKAPMDSGVNLDDEDFEYAHTLGHFKYNANGKPFPHVTKQRPDKTYYHRVFGNNQTSHVISLDENGEDPVAHMIVDHKSFGPQISESTVDKSYRGKGYGKALYLNALKHHKTLESDDAISPSANSLYQKLARHPNVSAKLDNFPGESTHRLEFKKGEGKLSHLPKAFPFEKSIKLSIFETFEDLEKSEAPKYEGHIDEVKNRVGKLHPNGILMWHQTPQTAEKHDSIINNPKHLNNFLSKIPDTHKGLMQGIIKQVASDPNRHFIPTEEGGRNKLRARHIKDLILGNKDINIDTSEPNVVKISRLSHSQGQNIGRTINFEFSQKRKA